MTTGVSESAFLDGSFEGKDYFKSNFSNSEQRKKIRSYKMKITGRGLTSETRSPKTS